MAKPYYSANGHWMPTYPGRVCAHCGEKFDAHREAQRFCSRTCSGLANSAAMKTARTCPSCGTVWSAKQSKKGKFCSRACLHTSYRKLRQKVCIECGGAFEDQSRKNIRKTCSDTCLANNRIAALKSRDVTDETRSKMSRAQKALNEDADWKNARVAAAGDGIRAHLTIPENREAWAKRGSDRLKRLHRDPEFRKMRSKVSREIMLRNWEKHRDRYVAATKRRYLNGEGISSEHGRKNRDRAWKWIMTKAQEALHGETNFDALFALTQARLREEHPFEGQHGTPDHHEYLRWLGHQVTSDPEIRSLADGFMSRRIPEIVAEWKERRRNGLEEMATASPEAKP